MEDNGPLNPQPKPPEQPPKPPRMTREHLNKRIDAIHDTVKQARSALLLCILASGAMFLCLWNTYASWDRDFAFLDEEDFVGVHEWGKDTNPPLVDNKVLFITEQQVKNALKGHKEFTRAQIAEAWQNHIASRPPSLHDHQMHSWIDTQVVSIALLGIKISVSDFAILGSGALAICSLYLLLCVRRENHEIGYLFREMSEADFRKLGPHALAMVSSFMVFNISDLHNSQDSVIYSLDKKKVHRGIPEVPLIREASSVLDFFPMITIVATIICDIGWTLWNTRLGHMFFLSPFRAQSKVPVLFHGFTWGEFIYFVIAEGFAILAARILYKMSTQVKEYDRGTRDLLVQVMARLVEQGLIDPRWPDIPPKNDSKQKSLFSKLMNLFSIRRSLAAPETKEAEARGAPGSGN